MRPGMSASQAVVSPFSMRPTLNDLHSCLSTSSWTTWDRWIVVISRVVRCRSTQDLNVPRNSSDLKNRSQSMNSNTILIIKPHHRDFQPVYPSSLSQPHPLSPRPPSQPPAHATSETTAQKTAPHKSAPSYTITQAPTSSPWYTNPPAPTWHTAAAGLAQCFSPGSRSRLRWFPPGAGISARAGTSNG